MNESINQLMTRLFIEQPRLHRVCETVYVVYILCWILEVAILFSGSLVFPRRGYICLCKHICEELLQD